MDPRIMRKFMCCCKAKMFQLFNNNGFLINSQFVLVYGKVLMDQKKCKYLQTVNGMYRSTLENLFHIDTESDASWHVVER